MGVENELVRGGVPVKAVGLAVRGKHGSRVLVARAVLVLVGRVSRGEAAVVLVLVGVVVVGEVGRLAVLVSRGVELVLLKNALLLLDGEGLRAAVDGLLAVAAAAPAAAAAARV